MARATTVLSVPTNREGISVFLFLPSGKKNNAIKNINRESEVKM